MNKEYKLYTLEHPNTGEVRYIGFTTESLEKRLYNHCKCFKNKTKVSHKEAWIKNLLRQNLVPIIRLLEVVDEANWESSEIYWIAQFKAWGFRLINFTEGGKGCLLSHKNKKSLKPSAREVPILQYNLEGVLLKEWESASKAGRELDINYKSISLACNKKSTSAGFQWRHKSNNLVVTRCTTKQNRKIFQYSTDNKLIKIWNTTQSILKLMKLQPKDILNSIKTNKEVGGFNWKYEV